MPATNDVQMTRARAELPQGTAQMSFVLLSCIANPCRCEGTERFRCSHKLIRDQLAKPDTSPEIYLQAPPGGREGGADLLKQHPPLEHRVSMPDCVSQRLQGLGLQRPPRLAVQRRQAHGDPTNQEAGLWVEDCPVMF